MVNFTTKYAIIISRKMAERIVHGNFLWVVVALCGGILFHLKCFKWSEVFLGQAHRSCRSEWLKTKIVKYYKIIVEREYFSCPTYVGQDKDNIKSFLGTRIMVLKPFISEKEKGVLHIKFSKTIELVPQYFNMELLLQHYYLVLEPSWTGLCDKAILQYNKYNQLVFVLAPEENDHNFLKNFVNFVPVRLGPSDWVDPRIAEKYLNCEKKYDILMNANWAPWKRHYLFFDILSRLPSSLRVVLIGVPWEGYVKQHIERLAGIFSVQQHIDFFERISYEEVIRLNCSSKISILLSLKEGSNRALAESMFCDVPVLLTDKHVGGIVKNINDKTGLIVGESIMHQEVMNILNGKYKFTPRQWAIENISCVCSSEILNEIVKTEIRYRFPDSLWTADLAIRCNSPESKYYIASVEPRLAPYNRELAQYLQK